MTFLLYFRETLILTDKAEQVRKKLMRQIRRMEKFSKPYSGSLMTVDLKKFNGFIEKDKFRLFRTVQAPQNFMPLVVGRIEQTSKGCIVFLKYKLLFSTRMFLIFWISVSIFFTVYFLFYYKHLLLAVVSLALGFISYFIAVAGYRMHLRKTRDELHSILY